MQTDYERWLATRYRPMTGADDGDGGDGDGKDGKDGDDGGHGGDQSVPYARFAEVNRRAKDADKRATDLQAQLAKLQQQIEEREQQGLPELERERQKAERLERQVQEANQKAEDLERRLATTAAERLVAGAASKLNFHDPDDAARLLGDVTDVEDASEAERRVKALAKEKPHLVKQDDPNPNPLDRVLQDGRRTDDGNGRTRQESNIQPEAEAEMVAANLREIAKRKGWLGE